MNQDEYRKMYLLEKEYWWFLARYAFMESLFERYVKAPDGPGPRRIVDLACGTGEVMKGLEARGQVFGIDLAETALRFCRERNLNLLVQSRAQELPLATGSVDVIVCLDAFEHIREDLDAMGECFRALKPGGVLITGVPALGFLWSEHDEALHHLRRYSRREFRRKLEHQGFTLDYLSYGFFLLFWPAMVLRMLQSFRKDNLEPQTQLFPVSPWFNQLLLFLHRIEARILGCGRFPIGLSLFAVARKPRQLEFTSRAGAASA